MLENDQTPAAIAEALAKSADYRVLRRLVPRTTPLRPLVKSTKTGILLDAETTDLDQQEDEVVDRPVRRSSSSEGGRNNSPTWRVKRNSRRGCNALDAQRRLAIRPSSLQVQSMGIASLNPTCVPAT
jgi:hypothetical protein